MNRKATLVLTGATIYAGKNLPTDYDYVALDGNKIMELGKGQPSPSLIDDNTKVFEYDKNTMVTPGFHDNHVHLVLAGMLDKYVSVAGCKSQEEAAQKAKDFADTIPDEKWVIGFGFSKAEWSDRSLPVKDTLDALIPDRPVLLMDNELHSAWANSKALELAGVTADTKDPEFGEIDRLPDGSPKGFLYESALTLVAKYAFDFESDVVEDLIKRYMKTANSYGITSTSDMTPYLGIDMSYYDVFKKMAVDSELSVRVNAARNLFEDNSIFLKMKEETDALDTDMYKLSYYKQFVDGVPSNHTALMLDDYCDTPGDKGGPLLPLDQLDSAVETANKNGIPVKLHACGDGAVNVSLNAFERADQAIYGEDAVENESDVTGYEKGFLRNQIEHIEVMSKDDIPRFGELGVIASIQPEHIVSGIESHSDNDYPMLLGTEREKYTWPFKSLLETGAVLACGSDMPVVPGVPFEGLYVGMTRVHTDGTPEGGWNPQEKLSIEELIDGYTYGASFGEYKEEVLGTLEEGKLADISVFDTNFLEAKPEAIRDAKAVLTIVDGKVVYQA